MRFWSGVLISWSSILTYWGDVPTSGVVYWHLEWCTGIWSGVLIF